MYDEWKERWRYERANERSVSEMFSSLIEINTSLGLIRPHRSGPN
jgi:hypothetical protein